MRNVKQISYNMCLILDNFRYKQFLNDFLFTISRFYGLTKWRYFYCNIWSDKKSWSINCKSIVLPLLQVEIPAKKRKHLTLKVVNAITNDIQRDNPNQLQIIRVITDKKFWNVNFWGTSNFSADVCFQCIKFFGLDFCCNGNYLWLSL